MDITSPYEKPKSPEVLVRGYNQRVMHSTLPIIEFLEKNDIFRKIIITWLLAVPSS
jgi:adenylylsulfate kinase-like enzyme